MVTRKLRRRHYEPIPTVEKRRKVAPLSSLVYMLEENDVEEDIKMIFKVCGADPLNTARLFINFLREFRGKLPHHLRINPQVCVYV